MKNQIRVAVALPTNYGEQGIVVSGGVFLRQYFPEITKMPRRYW